MDTIAARDEDRRIGLAVIGERTPSRVAQSHFGPAAARELTPLPVGAQAS